MVKKTKNNAEDILALVHEQMIEDRKTIKSSYDHFKGLVTTREDYAVNGPNINKCLELLTKQTGQMLEYAKAVQGDNKKKKETLTEDDAEIAYDKIKDKTTSLQ